MAKVIPISPTLLNTFLTCPRQYEAKYITKEVVFQPTVHTEFGNRAHKNIEEQLRHNAAATEETKPFAPVVEWVRQYAQRDGVEMLIEEKMGVDENLNPVPYNKRYIGAITDVTLVDHTNRRNINIDWKTGKKKSDDTQSQIVSLCATKRTGYETNINLWAFIAKGGVDASTVILNDLTPISTLFENIERYKKACAEDNFRPTPNGLCKSWCDVVACPHNGRNK